MLKQTILSQLIENLVNVHRFVKDRDLLISSVVDETLRTVQKWSADINRMHEIVGSKRLGGVLETLSNSPDTRELMTKLCEDAVEFLELYGLIEGDQDDVKEMN